jgi:hypothetical protein
MRTKQPHVAPHPLVMGIQVDLDALARLRHACDPLLCRHTRCCCKSYEVVVDPSEIRTIVGVVPQAARYARRLKDGRDYDDPFEQSDGTACIAAAEDGRCVFAFNTKSGLRCALHAAALDLELSPMAVKPKACALWPLFFDECDPPLLTVQNDALLFPCNTPRRSAGLHKGVAAILDAVFGAEFRCEVEKLTQRAAP